MFDKTAQFYDLLYVKGMGKDYTAEVDAMVARLPSTTTTLLDVACGTGLHLQHLAAWYRCEGVDLDEGMLAIARQRCPDVPVHVGDMVDFDLGRRFDAIVCLFSSIGYVRTEERLRSTAATMARHLEPGGMLLVETWLTPDLWNPGHTSLLVAEDGPLKVCRMNASGPPVDGCSVVDFHYLIATPEGVEHTTEHHVLGLFTLDQYRDAFERAGLDTTIDPTGSAMGRPLITARS